MDDAQIMMLAHTARMLGLPKDPALAKRARTEQFWEDLRSVDLERLTDAQFDLLRAMGVSQFPEQKHGEP